MSKRSRFALEELAKLKKRITEESKKEQYYFEFLKDSPEYQKLIKQKIGKVRKAKIDRIKDLAKDYADTKYKENNNINSGIIYNMPPRKLTSSEIAAKANKLAREDPAAYEKLLENVHQRLNPQVIPEQQYYDEYDKAYEDYYGGPISKSNEYVSTPTDAELKAIADAYRKTLPPLPEAVVRKRKARIAKLPAKIQSEVHDIMFPGQGLVFSPHGNKKGIYYHTPEGLKHVAEGMSTHNKKLTGLFDPKYYERFLKRHRKIGNIEELDHLAHLYLDDNEMVNPKTHKRIIQHKPTSQTQRRLRRALLGFGEDCA